MNKIVKKYLWITSVLAGLSLYTSAAWAIPELEINDTFASRQILPAGTTSVEGSLDPTTLAPDVTISNNSLNSGGVHMFSRSPFTPGDAFFAWTDNDVGGPNPDTILGTFDDVFTLIDTDDDSSPVGDGYASLISGAVNPDGSINLGVTGYPDFAFSGGHTEEGLYELFVQFGMFYYDIDFLSFVGLTPGALFEAEIISAVFDSMIGWVDEGGAIIAVDDDGGVGLLSLLSGIVPASGNVNLAVTAYDDFGLTGNHTEFGEYNLSFRMNARAVPEPATLALFGIGLAGLGFARKKRKST